MLGFVLGLALLTKLTAVVYAFALAALLAVAYFNRGLAFGRALALGSLSYAIAGAIWLPWGLRNLRLYGELTGEQRANIPFRWSSAALCRAHDRDVPERVVLVGCGHLQ